MLFDLAFLLASYNYACIFLSPPKIEIHYPVLVAQDHPDPWCFILLVQDLPES